MDTMCVRDFRRASISARCQHWILALGFAASAMSVVPGQAQEMCGGQTYPFPYTDVSAVGAAFCPGIMEAYVTGISKGTTPTTFSPNNDVTRVQMTTFLQRTVDQVLTRGSRRAALDQWWTPQNNLVLQTIDLGGSGTAWQCKSDGQRVWVADGPVITSVWASTGEVQGHDPGFTNTESVLVTAGQIITTDRSGEVVFTTAVLAGLGFGGSVIFPALAYHPYGIAYDGATIWTANYDDGTVTRILFDVSSVASGFPGTPVGGFTRPIGLVYDGANIWVTDGNTASKLHKLHSDGSIAQTVAVGKEPAFPAFDGVNIWVPNSFDNSITVVRAATGTIVATIPADASNNLSDPIQAAFDGERILVTNYTGDSVTLFRAADLSFIANVSLPAGSHPFGVCSDGINFWVVLNGTHKLARY